MNHTAITNVDVALLNAGLFRLMSIGALAGAGGVLLELELPGATLCASIAILCYSLLYVFFPSMSGALGSTVSELFYGQLPNVFTSLILCPLFTLLFLHACARATRAKASNWIKHLTRLLLLLRSTSAKQSIRAIHSDFRPYSRYLILLGHALPLRSPPLSVSTL